MDYSGVHRTYSEVDVIKMLDFLLTIFTMNCADRFFSDQLAFQWAQTALFYLPTYFFKGMKRSLYKFSQKQVRNTLLKTSNLPQLLK